jgi:hypothetical protein
MTQRFFPTDTVTAKLTSKGIERAVARIREMNRLLLSNGGGWNSFRFKPMHDKDGVITGTFAAVCDYVGGYMGNDGQDASFEWIKVGQP